MNTMNLPGFTAEASFFSTSVFGSCSFVAGYFRAYRSKSMIMGSSLESREGSNFRNLPCLVPAMPG
jgi:hypothetical protein